MKNVSYFAKDSAGNIYQIDAKIGEIDINNNNTIFLTDVTAIIELKNSNNIKIKSDFGKYNINNYDTIFSKNVLITYLNNKITGEYLDFSIARNSMVISRNVIYTNFENILKSDVIEMDIKTKDTKIFMYEKNNKVNVKSIN
jgi:lipopolysaccharide export system protein LptA